MTTTTDEHSREILNLRTELRSNIAAAQAAVRSIQRTQARLVELYDVEHAEGAWDLEHYLEEAERVLRVVEAVNPTRLGFTGPSGCQICGHFGGELIDYGVTNSRAPRIVCKDTQACGHRCADLEGGGITR